MKRIEIDPRFFSLEYRESYGIITALLSLKENGFSIQSEFVPNTFREIIENEGIEIVTPPEKDKLFPKIVLDNSFGNDVINVKHGSDIPNVLDAVKHLLHQERKTSIKRVTKETKIEIDLNLDGNGISNVSTGVAFFDHMLDQIARHGNVDLKISVNGDLHVDEHHTVEDVGIALGEAILKTLGDKKGIKRYGYFLPMDDTIARFAMDIGGRQYLNFKCKFNREFVGDFPTELTEEFFKGVAQGLNANLFIRAKGKNDHHKIEAIFKAFAKSLNEACRLDERGKGKLPTTKGII